MDSTIEDMTHALASLLNELEKAGAYISLSNVGRFKVLPKGNPDEGVPAALYVARSYASYTSAGKSWSVEE